MQVKMPKQGALQSLCSEWEHSRACVQSLVDFPVRFFICLFPAQADPDR